MKCLSWSDFKDVCITKKSLSLQYEDLGTQYHILGPDANGITWEITLNKLADDGSANADAADFETNFKANSNQPLEYRSSDGLVKFASAKFTEPLDFYVDGENGMVSLANGETKYSKTHYAFAYTLSGVDVKWNNANYGDYLDFEVGFYTNESDESTFTALNHFGNKYRFMDTGSRLFDVPTVKVVPSTFVYSGTTFNIYMRVKCVNAGPNASKVLINLMGWK